MADRYGFTDIESKWQQRWQEAELFEVRRDDRRPKFYYLDMYPYPSGDLHMGHARNYIIGDVIARCMRMRGHNVLHVMGWDAFGLPAENAAIERGIHPAQWTLQAIEKMRQDFDRLGISYDWGREINASDPEYYRWTQWLFLQLHHRGLAYMGEATVNWCPQCQTVLANEELEGDACERCHTPVEPKVAAGQWFFKITEYADRLLEDLPLLDCWPEKVRAMQEQWIGRSEGVEFDLRIAGTGEKIRVFTTRIDTIYGVTYVVLAPENPLVAKLTAGKPTAQPVRAFCRDAIARRAADRSLVERDRSGIDLGVRAVHPLTGEAVPIFAAPYVLMEYGTGAIMAVPAHDQRDLEFAREHNLPVQVVIQPPGETLDGATMTEAYLDEGIQVNSGQFDGLPNVQAQEAIADHLAAQAIGRRAVNYRLRDWLVSRQRYWGAPIPIIHCDACGPVPVPEADLPVLLPMDAEFLPGGESPLARHPTFAQAPCPKCGGPGRRETDTMTTFVCSSWYYLRFASPGTKEAPFAPEDVNYWLPVDKYVGGVEHAVRHLLYARFITKVLSDMGYIRFEEPFADLFTQGMILARMPDGSLEKMSKRGNAVAIASTCERLGADTGRVYILFIGPPEMDAEWTEAGAEGAHRFLQRTWRIVAGHAEAYDASWRETLARADDLPPAAVALRRKTHQTIRDVSRRIDDMRFNTAASALMELANELGPFAEQMEEDRVAQAVFSEAAEHLVLLLSPMAPHLCDELWERLGHDGFLLEHAWPGFDPELAKEAEITLAVQVNGKLRDQMVVPADTAPEAYEQLALQRERVQKFVEGKRIVKVIPVPGRLVNIVAK